MLGVFAAASALSFTGPWDLAERRIFDVLTRAGAPQRSALPITIVGIDEASFTQIGRQWPWPRSLFARLIDRLKERGAAVIALDIVLNEASTPQEDDALAAAIARAGNVVLAADHAYHETALFRQWLRVDPLPKFKQAGAASGLATAELDPDGVVRRVPQQRDALWRAVIDTFMRERPGLIPQPYVGPEDLIRHLGPAHTFPYVSFYQVVLDDPSLPRELFRDQIVLVGRDVRASPEAGTVHADMLATPFLASTRLLTPGVEIQATLVENAITGRTIEPATRGAGLLFAAAFLLLALPAAVRWHPAWSGAWMLGLAGAAVAAAYWALEARSYWMPLGLPAASLASFYGVLAAASIAGRPGIGSGTVRADLQHTNGVDPGDGPSAGPDGADVDGRHDNREVADHVFGGVGGLAIHHRHIGTRTSHVQRDDSREAGPPRDVCGTDHARGRAGEQSPHGLFGRPVDSHDTAVGFRGQELGAQASLRRPHAQPLEVTCHPRADVGVHHRHQAALVFPLLRPDVRARTDEQVGELLSD